MTASHPRAAPATPRHPQSVADYIVHRLSQEGVGHCFGVPGDYSFPLCDAVERSAAVKWIGCANELNAAYAADGYARMRGAAMLSTTYGVGELSALNGVMGAKAERSLVFHLVGMPSHQNERRGKIVHHTLGDGVFGNFVGLSAQAACCSALITPENCVLEMERVIAEARRHNQPAYIAVPSDFALSPVVARVVEPIRRSSNKAQREKAVAAIAERIEAASSMVVLPAFTLARMGLQKEAQNVIEALGCPFAATSMEKGLISERHPQFAGMYSGAASAAETREIVEGADLILDLGGVSLNDVTTACFSARLDPDRIVTIGLNDVRIGGRLIFSTDLADMLAALARLKPKSAPYRRKPPKPAAPTGDASDRISATTLYPRLAAFMRGGDNLVLETGSSSLGMNPLPLADDVRIEAQVLWGSVGWATAAALGIALADPSRRTIVLAGEGAHQFTANEIGGMERYGADVIFFVLNNGGYLVERALEENPDWSYNDLPQWKYSGLPRIFGCDDWFAARVETLGELDAAMKAAREAKSGAYIEIVTPRMDMPAGLAFIHARLDDMYGEAPAPIP